MTKITVSKKKCISCNACALLHPEIFVMNKEDGKAEVISQPKIKLPETIEIICPTKAISVKNVLEENPK